MRGVVSERRSHIKLHSGSDKAARGVWFLEEEVILDWKNGMKAVVSK